MCSSCLKGRKRNPEIPCTSSSLSFSWFYIYCSLKGFSLLPISWLSLWPPPCSQSQTEALLLSQDWACSKLPPQERLAQQNCAVDYTSCYLGAKSSNAYEGFSKQAFVNVFGVALGLSGQHPPPCCSPVSAWPQVGSSFCHLSSNPASLWWWTVWRCAVCWMPGLTLTLQSSSVFPWIVPASWVAPLAPRSLQWSLSTSAQLALLSHGKNLPGVFPVNILNLTGCYATWLFLCLPARWHLPWWGVQAYSVRAGPHQKRQPRQKTSPSRELWAHSQR